MMWDINSSLKWAKLKKNEENFLHSFIIKIQIVLNVRPEMNGKKLFLFRKIFFFSFCFNDGTRKNQKIKVSIYYHYFGWVQILIIIPMMMIIIITIMLMTNISCDHWWWWLLSFSSLSRMKKTFFRFCFHIGWSVCCCCFPWFHHLDSFFS